MLAARHWCPAPVCRGVLLRWAAAAAKSRQRPVSTLVPLPALRVVRRRPAALLAPRAAAASSRVPRAPPGAPVEASSPCSRPSTVGARGRVLSRIFEMTCASCGSPAASRDPLLAGPGAGGVDGASRCRDYRPLRPALFHLRRPCRCRCRALTAILIPYFTCLVSASPVGASCPLRNLWVLCCLLSNSLRFYCLSAGSEIRT